MALLGTQQDTHGHGPRTQVTLLGTQQDTREQGSRALVELLGGAQKMRLGYSDPGRTENGYISTLERE